jgi:hypothetical protein
MTPLDRRRSHGPTANGDRPRRAGLGASREARIQRVFDGVVASYIHDISVRHREPRREPVAAGELR